MFVIRKLDKPALNLYTLTRTGHRSRKLNSSGEAFLPLEALREFANILEERQL
jgi:hypothetical protein